ncbi:MAG: YraN family protein [Clostridia bacterium]|nr:YraN family protein [Clostridia bacterium]
MNTRYQGSLVEAEVCRYIQKLGMLPLCKNYKRFTGEIDLIAKEKDTIVFIEVKARATDTKGSPAEAVTRTKQRRIIMTALMYLKENHIYGAKMRFDVAAVSGETIKYIRSAFGAEQFRMNK